MLSQLEAPFIQASLWMFQDADADQNTPQRLLEPKSELPSARIEAFTK